MKKLKNDLKILLRGYRIIFSLEKTLVPLDIISSILGAIFPFVNIFMSAEIINAFVRREETTNIIILVAITLVLNIVMQQSTQITTRILNVKTELFERKFEMLLNNKILDMDYDRIENPDTHMKKQRVLESRNVKGGGIWKLVEVNKMLFGGLATIIASVALTIKVFAIYGSSGKDSVIDFIISPACSITLVLFILGNMLLSMYFNSKNSKESFETWNNVISFNRFFFFLMGDYINSYKAGKDVRLYSQKNMVMENLGNVLQGIRPTFFGMKKIQIKYSNINAISTTAISVFVYIFVGLKTLTGLIGLGDLFKFINSIVRFSGGLNELLNAFNELRVNNKFLLVLFEFLDIPSNMYHGSLTTEKRSDRKYDIEFRNVSFKYPATENYALKNVSLRFAVGQKMAVVGMNGSGKTTFIKLLCRLYDPIEGEILLNGIDIRKYNYHDYMSIFSVVFQDFKLFSFGLGQNVAASVEVDERRVADSLGKAGLFERFSSMTKGLDTPLYKDFEEDGVEISGGEAQKIALARALYKNAPFIVLDEPTAALDPIAEFEVYSKFNEIVGDKTAIYISHRLSSCRFCDDIVVFHEGKLIQRGSHDTLIGDVDGKYFELWNAQAQYYTQSTL